MQYNIISQVCARVCGCVRVWVRERIQSRRPLCTALVGIRNFSLIKSFVPSPAAARPVSRAHRYSTTRSRRVIRLLQSACTVPDRALSVRCRTVPVRRFPACVPAGSPPPPPYCTVLYSCSASRFKSLLLLSVLYK